MIAFAQNPPSAPPTVRSQQTTNSSSSTKTPPATEKQDSWKVVGFWSYDAADGQNVPSQGLVMRTIQGTGLGQQWQAHLELKNHSSLSPRNRSLWPVMINTKQRKVCANYPGYPSYPAFIDMPGESDDGIYQIPECNGT